MPTVRITLSLMENALDSIRRAIDLLAWKDITHEGSRLKQAILLVAHANELFLKERLSRIDPALVWKKVETYPNLEARTVGVVDAIKRLEKNGGIVIDDVDQAMLSGLRSTRNAIEHFKWDTDRTEANRIIAQALSFAISFAATELQTEIAELFSGDDTWDNLINEHSAFSRAHGDRIYQELKARGKPVQECSSCNQLTQDMHTGACSLCGHWENLDD